jgi:hypothetical protein
MLAVLLLVSILAASPQKAAAMAAQDSMISSFTWRCDPENLLIRKAMRVRMDFALSDGRGNALGLRSGERLLGLSEDEKVCRRLNFSWSDGRGDAFDW